MKFVIIVLFLVCISCNNVFLPNTIPENYTNCYNNSIITINQAFAMTQPARGENITFILLGNVSDIVQMKEVKLSCSFDGLEVITLDYKDSSVFSPGQQCEFKFVQFIPSYLPSGKYTLNFKFMDVSGNEDGCIKLIYHLSG
eukprot:TRINITY_DN412_c0_g1_i4.p1 TRINITY_DN412_c0_g1~~TRINITY_DN412_c0_g1_i4.p1  ORF type:complete len:142 (+),score=19.27 TRINITY_DN412_c0_g1_i4:702-1127(+)